MYDKKLVMQVIKNIVWALGQIEKRFQGIDSAKEFVRDDNAIAKLDSICMQLINIGEALKHLDKITNSRLLRSYPQIDWKRAKGMRDIITHRYFDIDAETVFTACRVHLPQMRDVMRTILRDLQKTGKT